MSTRTVAWRLTRKDTVTVRPFRVAFRPVIRGVGRAAGAAGLPPRAGAGPALGPVARAPPTPGVPGRGVGACVGGAVPPGRLTRQMPRPWVAAYSTLLFGSTTIA